MSVANQKIIIINKQKVNDNFLQIKIPDWQLAFQKLKPAAFGVYLYLASNADGFNLELSPVAIENAIGIKKTAYYDALKQLEAMGYIKHFQGNLYNFYTWPSC